MDKIINLKTFVIEQKYKDHNNNLINTDIYENLIYLKNKINKLNDNKIWDKAKKLSNEYELIYLPNKKNKKNSIAHYDPLSRSYFKMWEILHDFNLFQSKNKLNILCLAEGPGGFIEAINNYRRSFNIIDNIQGITLKSTNKDIPGWKKSKIFLNKYDNIQITYGKDNTGNLYNIDNIKYLSIINPNKYSFITADGGFDFSLDFNNQEKLSYKIIFCEIVSAFYNQQIEGNFVCKIYDIYTIITVKMLYLLMIHYEDVYIIKPLTSRPANSEKYIICKNFIGIDTQLMNKLLSYISNWNDCNKDFLDCNKDFLDFITVPIDFITRIKQYNEYITNKQINNIKKTLHIINTEENLSNLDKINKCQIQKAMSWCTKYNVSINNNSDFIQVCE